MDLLFAGLCTPYVAKCLAKQHKTASEAKVATSTNGMHEVRNGGDHHRVCLRKMTCTCNKWQVRGIPCEHAYAVIIYKKLVAEDYVCQWFRSAMWRRNYTDGLCPQRGAKYWPVTDTPDVHVPPQPNQTGRKKVTKAAKKRKESRCESPNSKQPKHKKRIMHCTICGQANHNSAGHKKLALKVSIFEFIFSLFLV